MLAHAHDTTANTFPLRHSHTSLTHRTGRDVWTGEERRAPAIDRAQPGCSALWWVHGWSHALGEGAAPQRLNRRSAAACYRPSDTFLQVLCEQKSTCPNLDLSHLRCRLRCVLHRCNVALIVINTVVFCRVVTRALLVTQCAFASTCRARAPSTTQY